MDGQSVSAFARNLDEELDRLLLEPKENRPLSFYCRP